MNVGALVTAMSAKEGVSAAVLLAALAFMDGRIAAVGHTVDGYRVDQIEDKIEEANYTIEEVNAIPTSRRSSRDGRALLRATHSKESDTRKLAALQLEISS